MNEAPLLTTDIRSQTAEYPRTSDVQHGFLVLKRNRNEDLVIQLPGEAPIIVRLMRIQADAAWIGVHAPGKRIDRHEVFIAKQVVT